MTEKTIEELRKTITEIDEKILELIIERVAVAKKVAAVRSEAGETLQFDAQRELNILEFLTRKAADRLTAEEITRVFLQIISVSRSRQSEKKICVFGEKNGWVEDAALARFGNSAAIAAVDNTDDFLAQTDSGNHGFACSTPQFTVDRNAMIENMLAGKISVVEKLVFSPEFSVVSNRACDLSEVHELCVTNEMLRLLRSYFLAMSYDIKIKICRSCSEAYENLQSINPVAAVLPTNLLKNRSDLIVIRDGLKSEVLGPVSFMSYAHEPRQKYDSQQRAMVLCGVNGDSSKLLELLGIMQKYNLHINDIQTADFENKPWQKIVTIEMSLPESKEKFDQILGELEEKCVMVKVCGLYPLCTL